MLYAEQLRFVSNGSLFSGRTNGINDAGILTPDIKFSGMVGLIKLGETVVIGDVMYPNSANQDWRLSDASTGVVLGPVAAMALQAGDADDYVLAIFDGYVKYDSWLTTEYLAIKARAVLTVSDVTVDAQIITMNTSVLGNDISDDGVVAGSTFLVVPAGTSLAQFKTVASKALINAALVAETVDPLVRVETDWATNDLAFVALNAGVLANTYPSTETFTNGSWDVALFTGGTDAGRVYMSETAGKTTPTAPSDTGDLIQVVGQALSPTELLFKPMLQLVSA